MSEDKKTTKTVAKADEVEIVERSQEEMAAENGEKGQEAKAPELKDGVYTEYGVELSNGVHIDVGVVVDADQLPATVSSLMAEGNTEALVVAQMTAGTRRMMDFAGATRKDLREVFPPVIERARAAADAAEDK